MDDFNNILVDGEQIVWSGRPTWGREKSRFAYLRGKIISSLFLIAFLTGSLEFARSENNGVAIAFLIFAGFAALFLFSQSPSSSRRRDKHYLMTDRRILVLRERPEERVSFSISAITALNLAANGGVRDVTLRTGDGEADFVTLYALEDAAKFEKLLVSALR